MSLITLQAKVDKTAAFTGTTEVDISGQAEDCTITIRVLGLTAGKKAMLSLEDTVNNFGAARAVWIGHFVGALSDVTPDVLKIRKRDLPMCRFGTASAELRLNVLDIDGSATITYEAWLENAD